ncbi:hypothetical protein [Paenibacillus amylolyticus]|nr:hypothetical protein [Paenibacillus amylolyticus]
MDDYRLNLIMQGVQALVSCFESPLFLAFTAMLAMAVAHGIKRLMIE